MLYKIINGGLSCPPETLRINNKIITNFDKSEELQKIYGYKRLVDGDIPEYDAETEEIFVNGYIETIVYEAELIEEVEEVEPIKSEGGEVVIMPVYGVRPIPEPELMPEPMPTIEDRVKTLEDELTNTQIAVAEVFEIVEGGV